MRKRTSRFLSVLISLAFVLSMFAAAMAAGDIYEGADTEEHTYYGNGEEMLKSIDGLYVKFMPGYLSMTQGETVPVDAIVTGGDNSVIYSWACDDPAVAAVMGSGAAVTVKAVGPGTARITLTATKKSNGDYDVDVLTVTVKPRAPRVDVKINGQSELSLTAGESAPLSVSVSGGTGSYIYEWEGSGSAGVEKKSGPENTVYARYAGKGTVSLTVIDEENLSNYFVARWKVDVSGNKSPVSAKLNKTELTLSAGQSETLRVSASGGSGSDYDYYWNSDTPGAVSISANGAEAKVTASDTIVAGVNTAQISVTAVDRQTKTTSQTLYCVVTVRNQNASFDISDTAVAGSKHSMETVAQSLSSAFESKFGKLPGASASVRIREPQGMTGMIRLSDGVPAAASESYTFDQLRRMYFDSSVSGRFQTAYTVTDGASVITGTLTINASGGAVVSDAELSEDAITMDVYSSKYLGLTLTPAKADCTVSWTSSDTSVAAISGSGKSVTVVSQGVKGTATVTATIKDAGGNTLTRSCEVTVGGEKAEPGKYDPTVTVMMGSDYYGTAVSDSISKAWNSAYNTVLSESAEIRFTGKGSERYGVMCLENGVHITMNVPYTFGAFRSMYFEPYAAGTYTLPYSVSHNGMTLSGTMSVEIKSSNLSVTMDTPNLSMPAYSSRIVNVSVYPESEYKSITWTSSNTSVVSVTGSGTAATLTSTGKTGSAAVTAVITDNNDNRLYSTCSVTVSGGDSQQNYDPAVYTTIGVNYAGTGTSDAMRAQFKSIYGLDIKDSEAKITFSNTGNPAIGVMRLKNGIAIRPDTEYGFDEYIAMYTEPVSTGTFSVPYALSFGGKTLSGTVSVIISEGSVNCTLVLPGTGEYALSDDMSGSTGAKQLADAIKNAVGTSWTHVRFKTSQDRVGTLTLQGAALSENTKVTAEDLEKLHFTANLPGTFTAEFTVYSDNGKLARGRLKMISGGTGAEVFEDVDEGAFYADAVSYALKEQITTGTGATEFSPASAVTRAQAVTFLWRANGKPLGGEVNPFTDVPADAYYTEAVLWAVKQGITTGMTETTFGPDETLTEDQMLTFICRADGARASGEDWSEAAMQWADREGLFAGMPQKPTPKAHSPRCNVVYYIWKDAQ